MACRLARSSKVFSIGDTFTAAAENECVVCFVSHTSLAPCPCCVLRSKDVLVLRTGCRHRHRVAAVRAHGSVRRLRFSPSDLPDLPRIHRHARERDALALVAQRDAGAEGAQRREVERGAGICLGSAGPSTGLFRPKDPASLGWPDERPRRGVV